MKAQAAALSVLLLAGAILALQVNGYFVFVLANVALLALVGIGLNVLLGLTGQVSFGHVGFYAIGAYSVAILTTRLDWSFWLAWPVGASLAAMLGAGLALPALRVKGPYLAMITIAFGFVIEHSIVEMGELTGGQNGIMGVPAPSLGALAQGERAVALLALATVALALVGFALLSRGTWGVAMRAVRDADTAAAAIGLNALGIKMTAFALSALCAGAAGGLFAPLSGFVTPHTFGFIQSILFVLVVMIGGSGSLAGPIVGALIVGLLPEWLASLEEYRLILFGALLLVVLWVAPNGMTGLFARWRKRWLPRRAPTMAAAHARPTLPSRSRRSLAAQGLTMQFGGLQAVGDLDLEAMAGQVSSLIGPNGAGKTTALNMLSGFYLPSAGQFQLGGQALAGRSSMDIARAGIARTYQTSQLFDSLSVIDNVVLAMHRGRLGPLLGNRRQRGAHNRDRALSLLAYCGYRGGARVRAGDLAHVDRRLVEIARALAMDPDMILLDEPAAGLSHEDKASLSELLRRIADAGIGVLLVEHDMALVMGISDHVVVLDAGRLLAAGTPSAIQNDPAVRQAYLGEAVGRESVHRASCSRLAARERSTPRERLGIGALVTGYGAEPVLHGIDLQVHDGEVVALLGANGAGKSTLMRSISGLHRPVQGGIHLDGHELGQLGAEQIVARGLVLVPEGRQVFPELTVLDNIRLGAFLKPAASQGRIDDMLDRFPRLRERLDQRAGLLSGGEQQMLAIARGLMGQPKILLLDEPSLGLAPLVIHELFDALDELRAEGMTLLLVDQMAGLALALADRAYVIDGGKIVAQGSAAQVAADDRLARAYLGDAPPAANAAAAHA